jgi:hypothetical protein
MPAISTERAYPKRGYLGGQLPDGRWHVEVRPLVKPFAIDSDNLCWSAVETELIG